MFPYILCTCGRNIGCYYDLYRAMLRKALEEYKKDHEVDIDPVFIPAAEIPEFKQKEILKKLNLKLCCEIRMKQQIRFYDVL